MAIGRPGSPALAAAAASASRLLLPLHVERDASAADGWLGGHHPPAILLDSAHDLEDACLRIRYSPSLANVPILAVASAVDELGFEESLCAGADDLCSATPDAIGARLRRILVAGDIPVSRRRGTAVVAGRDRRSRVLAGRALRNAGYGVKFAVDGACAVLESTEGGNDLVVWRAQDDELDDVGHALAEARARSSTAKWVIGVAPKHIRAMRERVGSSPCVAVYDAYGPAEDVLFIANDLVRNAGVDGRQSARILYGTTVRFRASGTDHEEVGFTYNISAAGLYVRTLAPPSAGEEMWLELRPPRTGRLVRLDAQVAWTRAFGPNDVATVPPGFGVQVSGGSVADLERYVRGYRTFAAEIA